MARHRHLLPVQQSSCCGGPLISRAMPAEQKRHTRSLGGKGWLVNTERFSPTIWFGQSELGKMLCGT
jgi:hypothetical protein